VRWSTSGSGQGLDVTAPLRCLVALTCAALVGCSSSPADPEAAPSRSPSPSPSAPAPPPPASVAPPTGTGTYLALGDSVAAGVGAVAPETEGYVPVLARSLPEPPAVRDLAVPGATTASLLQEQVPRALAVLAGGEDVRLVTVTVGGNDVFLPVVQSCARSVEDPACPRAVRRALQQVDTGVDEVLQRLTAAAGPGTPVAVMTYYDPLPACRLAPLSPLAEQVLEGTDGQQGLNDVLRARAQEHGAVVVETAERLRPPEDFVGGLDCLHPSTSGHAKIAQAFLDAVGTA
jgi:lysophospholipase L1-like esterase